MIKREADSILLACKKQVGKLEPDAKLNFSNYPTRKNRPESGITLSERMNNTGD